MPVAYLSKLLNKLVVIRELENWKHLIKSIRFKFEIWTDYKNLKYFMKVQKLNRKQEKWVLYLSRFDFILKYIPGIIIERQIDLVGDQTGK